MWPYFIPSILLWSVIGVCVESATYLEDIKKNDRLLSPPWLATGERTEVEVQLYISNIRGQSDTPKLVSITFYLHQVWEDRRLQYNTTIPEFSNSPVDYISIPDTYRSNIWVPDIQMKNTISSNIVESPVYLLRVYPNGTLLQSTQLTSTLVCPLVNDFPREFQTCTLTLQSYSYSTKEVYLTWRSTEAVEFTKDMQISYHTVIGTTNTNYSESYSIGNYSSLVSKIDLKRIYSVFSVIVYIPSLLLVFLSWLTFWIDRSQVPARMSVCALITMSGVTHITGTISMLHTSAISKQAQSWLAVSLVFMVSSTLEFVVIHTLSRLRVKKALDGKNTKDDLYENTKETNQCPEGEEQAVCPPSIFRKIRRNPGKLDTIFRGLFPVLFIIFNLFYWPYYLT
ncbi:hypothetical protein ScPMuIL_009770 [Solemya velum]